MICSSTLAQGTVMISPRVANTQQYGNKFKNEQYDVKGVMD